MNHLIRKFALFTLQIGIDPRRFLSLKYFNKYRIQRKAFVRSGGLITHTHAIFTDYKEQAGSAKGHYFHQDLLVASYIHKKNPTRHIDIGSRVDGFVAHVASYRQIDVMDVRDLRSTGHSNISFIKADLMDINNTVSSTTDSISCLHAIEHFGLGRYGDPINPNGHIDGFNNILRMLKVGGNLYISFPIGKSNEVHFNAHRVFHPLDIFTWIKDKDSLKLDQFDYVDDKGNLHLSADLESMDSEISYGCGIYTFSKLR
jgi:Caenorhabditis protein of unknown function, DUF268